MGGGGGGSSGHLGTPATPAGSRPSDSSLRAGTCVMLSFARKDATQAVPEAAVREKGETSRRYQPVSVATTDSTCHLDPDEGEEADPCEYTAPIPYGGTTARATAKTSPAVLVAAREPSTKGEWASLQASVVAKASKAGKGGAHIGLVIHLDGKRSAVPFAHGLRQFMVDDISTSASAGVMHVLCEWMASVDHLISQKKAAGDAAQAILLKPLVHQLWNIVGHYLRSPVAASGGGQPIVLVLQPQQHGDAKDQANAVTAVISLAALQQGKDVDADGVTPKEAVEAVLAPYLKHVVGWRERPTVREVVHRQVPLACCAWHGVVRVLDLPRTALRHVQDLLRALAMASGAGAGRASLGVPVSHPGPALTAAAEAAEDMGGVEVDGEDAVPQVDSHHLPVPADPAVANWVSMVAPEHNNSLLTDDMETFLSLGGGNDPNLPFALALEWLLKTLKDLYDRFSTLGLLNDYLGASEMLKNLLSQLLRCNLRTSCAIVFVAASGNGKSTFIGRLLQDSFCPPGPDCTTVHRDVYHITYPVPNEELVREVELVLRAHERAL